MKVLVTGAAGFIGMHCAERLLARGDQVAGLDNLSPYYSVQLKKDRLARLQHKAFRFSEVDIANAEALEKVFLEEKPETVLHLAAQAADSGLALRLDQQAQAFFDGGAFGGQSGAAQRLVHQVILDLDVGAHDVYIIIYYVYNLSY